MRLSIEEKQTLVTRYHAGESVAEICADTGVARNTFYTWIKPYSVSAANAEHAVSQQELHKMKQKIKKLEQTVEIL